MFIVLKQKRSWIWVLKKFDSGLNHGFCQNIKSFSLYCFNAKWINEKSFEKFKNKKRLNLTKKNIGLKQVKICIFFKRVRRVRRIKKCLKFTFFQRGSSMVFVKKLNLFPSFVLMQNESIKRVLKSSKTKKP